MQISDYIPARQMIPHPNCPDCGAPMLLARIEPDEPGHDIRMFECRACLKEVMKIVKCK
jgi:hypothetical protein